MSKAKFNKSYKAGFSKQYHIFELRSLFATFESLKSVQFPMHVVVRNSNLNLHTKTRNELERVRTRWNHLELAGTN